jgi:hypothetical protein
MNHRSLSCQFPHWRSNRSRWRILTVTLLLLGPSVLHAMPYQISVASAPVDRCGIVVRFALPPEATPSVVLRDEQDREVPLQVERDRQACFIVADQAAGQTRTFRLVAGAPKAAGGVEIKEQGGGLQIAVDSVPALSFRTDKSVVPRTAIAEKFKRAGYLYQIFSPAGTIVTEDYPANHVHHHGLWTSWSRTQFQGRKPNFWEMAEQTGTVEFLSVERTWSGPVHGGLVSHQRFIDLSAPTAVAALDETWELTVYHLPDASPAVRVFDLTVTQTCATNDPVVLSQYHYGGLGFRGTDRWEGKGAMTVLTSEGETQRDRANGTRVRWCYLGDVAGRSTAAGIAILGSPQNLRAPQPIRVHPEMAFFSFAPTALGEMTITPGQPYVARYRFIVSDSAPGKDRLEAWWNGYAVPVPVTLEAR